MAEDEKKRRLPRGKKRLIYESFFADEDVGSLTRDERLLLVAMIAAADDEGKGRANEIVLQHLAFSFDEDVDDRDVKKMREHIRRKMRNVEVFVAGGTWFYQFKNWRRYQRIDHFEASFFPDFGEKVKRSGDEPVTGQQVLPSVDSLRPSSSLGDEKSPNLSQSSLTEPSLTEPKVTEPAKAGGATKSFSLSDLTDQDVKTFLREAGVSLLHGDAALRKLVAKQGLAKSEDKAEKWNFTPIIKEFGAEKVARVLQKRADAGTKITNFPAYLVKSCKELIEEGE